MSTAASATRLRCGPALARHLLHPPQLAAAASTAGVRRPLVMGAARVPQQQQQQSVGAVRHSTIWRKVQEGIQGKQAEKEGA